jgi:hypothetical protein
MTMLRPILSATQLLADIIKLDESVTYLWIAGDAGPWRVGFSRGDRRFRCEISATEGDMAGADISRLVLDRGINIE